MDLQWLSPEGKTYPCSYMEHISTAYELAKSYKDYDRDSRPDEFLMERNWIHITMSCFFGHGYNILYYEHPTPEQIRYLKPLLEDEWDNVDPACKYSVANDFDLEYSYEDWLKEKI